MNGRNEQTFRATMSSYFILGGAFGGTFAFTVYATIFTHPSFWRAAATFGAAFAFVLIWLAAFEIRISDEELRLRSLFGGVQRIKSDEISKVRLGFDLASNGGPLRLLVERKNRSTSSINAKVFSRDAIRAALEYGERVAVADSGGLEDGIVRAALRKRQSKGE